jgi:hypothetical protein
MTISVTVDGFAPKGSSCRNRMDMGSVTTVMLMTMECGHLLMTRAIFLSQDTGKPLEREEHDLKEG